VDIIYPSPSFWNSSGVYPTEFIDDGNLWGKKMKSICMALLACSLLFLMWIGSAEVRTFDIVAYDDMNVSFTARSWPFMETFIHVGWITPSWGNGDMINYTLIPGHIYRISIVDLGM